MMPAREWINKYGCDLEGTLVVRGSDKWWWGVIGGEGEWLVVRGCGWW